VVTAQRGNRVPRLAKPLTPMAPVSQGTGALTLPFVDQWRRAYVPVPSAARSAVSPGAWIRLLARMTSCLACGYGGLDGPLWDGPSASDEICPCCGLHYGYDDASAGRGDATSEFYVGWRARWILDGKPWFSSSRKPPAGWSADKQLTRHTRP
jgi:hypothetical protein